MCVDIECVYFEKTQEGWTSKSTSRGGCVILVEIEHLSKDSIRKDGSS